jgi:hypothetical protein
VSLKRSSENVPSHYVLILSKTDLEMHASMEFARISRRTANGILVFCHVALEVGKAHLTMSESPATKQNEFNNT